MMTQRHLPFVFIIIALFFPALACAAAEDDVLQAFGDAARTLPPVPVQKPKPQLKPVAPKLAEKPAVKSKTPEQLHQLRAQISELEKQKAALQLKNEQHEKALKEQQANSDNKRAALDEEKQQQTLNIIRLTQELKAAQQQTTDATALRKQLTAAQAAAKRDQDALKTQRVESEKMSQALQKQQSESEKKLASLNEVKVMQQQNIVKLTAELEAAKKQPAAVVAAAEPKTDAERDGYMLGQSIASNAVVQLQMVKDTGLTISIDQLIAGFSTQLQTGTSLMNSEEMSRRYAAMQETINKKMGSLIEKGYDHLNKHLEQRKALVTQNGVRWFAVKTVKAKLIPDQQVEVSVKVSTLGGKVINDFADDKVPFDNNLPPMLYEGMSLTGAGGAVEGWALAKDIIEREPLPPWVAPYDVIHYQLAIK
ncbi:hypothetical protein [Pantoea sp. PNT03]|uniref:hypothetical protein n=1 Tax=Pantoea sp. PNT03 TaxID=2769258 RepID=UPI0017825071|nr:hypothetical protein [Pantoea sp. PNT03]MBD9662017.1 hypothetical protein [Pantoea sp. PNT03]